MYPDSPRTQVDLTSTLYPRQDTPNRPRHDKRKSVPRSPPHSPPGSSSSSESEDHSPRRNNPRRHNGSPSSLNEHWHSAHPDNIVTYRLQEKAEHLLTHIPSYDGHEGSSGIKFISLADEFMHNNDETCHRMITALTSRFSPDSVAAHWHEAHVMRTVRSYWVGDDVKRPQGVKTYAFTNDMQGWYEFRNHFLARFTSELESVQLRIRLGKISWKSSSMTLDAHIAEFQNICNFLAILNSPVAEDDQLLQFIRSLSFHRDLATRVKFNMTMDEAIKAVQTRAANNSIHDLIVPRTPRNKQIFGGHANNLSITPGTPTQGEDDDLLAALEAGDFDYLIGDDDDEDNDDSLNAIGSGGRGGGRGRGRGGRGAGRGGRGAGRGTRSTMSAQQLEWFKDQKCIQCGQAGHFKRDCPNKTAKAVTFPAGG